ncbi:protein FAM114A2 [Biomphalaria glabrata]|uniref:Protein FAM114A2-like n=1 Tax=Biomphalaria glabrata TaxID=6526 RepID=A0A9U8DX33_BIOGL|nr:protein FAM114A2-like [Biomphalaria glabrata]XP_013064643.2 protein FAM114A2-like [Biomphalaria glabrata]KAI8734272.1 FAM114A2-like protein [Biomphalaria glabrata]
MSESDDETAFASADEGDDKKSKDTLSPKSKEMKSSETEQKKEIEKKDTGQKQQKQAPKNKKKGKGSNQTNAKEARPATKSSPSQSVATSPKPDVASSSNPDISEAKKESSPKPVGTKENKDLKVGEKTVVESPTPEESRSRARNSLPPESKVDPETDKSEKTSSNITAQKEPKDAGASEKTTATQVKAESRPNTETQSHDVVKTPEKQDIPRGQVDRSQQQEQILQNLGTTAEKSSRGGWGWSSWGSTILSAATNSVQTFTHQVGDGLSTIIDSVESSLGIPDPEDLAKDKSATEAGQSPEDTTSAITSQPEETVAVESENVKTQETDQTIDKESESTQEEEKKDKNNGGGWFSNWGVSDLAKKVTDTGKSLASKGQTLMSEGFDAVENLAAGGIDVLETIGKKTYNTLSEHDPAFRKTRDFLSPKSNKPNLSSVLREAKDRAEQEAEKVKENEEAMKAHFGTLFDDNQGLAHLEALEMLSNQSEKKVHSLLNSLSSKDLAEIKPLLISIKETFSVQEEDESAADTDQDVSGLVSQCLAQLKLGTASDKLNTVLEMVRQWIADTQENQEKDSIKDVHQKSIQALAELTAKGVEQFHKAGELILLEKNKENDFIEKSQSLARLTSVLCHEIGNLATRFVACLNKMAEKQENPDEITQFVTNIYLEATNSSTYIQDAFVLLLPVVQHAAIEHSVLFRES